MNILKKTVLFIVLILILTANVHANDILDKQYDLPNIDQMERDIPIEAKKQLGKFSYKDSHNFTDSLKSIIASAVENSNGIFKNAIKSTLKIFVIAVICSLSSSVFEMKTFDSVTICASAAILTVSVGDITSIGNTAASTLTSLNIFSKSLLPVLTAASAATGAITAAGIRHTAILFLSDVVITSITTLILPLTYTYIAICGANAICTNNALEKLGQLIKNVTSGALKITLSIYISILTLSSVISGSVDAVTAKTVKFTVSGAIPVVGSIIADAADTVIAGAVIVKNTIGVFGMLVILATVIIPVIKMGAMYLCYKLGATLSSICVKGEIINLIDAIGSAFGLMLGMIGACAMLLLVSIFTAIAAVTVR